MYNDLDFNPLASGDDDAYGDDQDLDLEGSVGDAGDDEEDVEGEDDDSSSW